MIGSHPTCTVSECLPEKVTRLRFSQEVKAQLAELQAQVQRLEELLRQVLAARAEE